MQTMMRIHLQTNQNKMDWWCDATGTVPALQVQTPELIYIYMYVCVCVCIRVCVCMYICVCSIYIFKK
jgi:hypothetical protein